MLRSRKVWQGRCWSWKF